MTFTCKMVPIIKFWLQKEKTSEDLSMWCPLNL